MNELELSALDGANPLGFLAALGTLVVLSETDPQLKLGWHAGARWTPFLTSPNPLDETKILQRLTKRLRGQPVSETAERKREASQKRFDAAKKRLKNANDELKALKLRGNQLKVERDRIVVPVRQRFEKRRQIVLARLKSAVPSPELALGQRPDCTVQEFREHAVAIRAESAPNGRTTADLLASFGAETADLENERIQPTAFCFITGSGHQWFLATVRQLMTRKDPTKQEPAPPQCVTDKSLHNCLFKSWAYSDEGLSMRWDPAEDVRYALRFDNPGPIGAYTVWMANLLAYFALGCFPCAALSHETGTACWTVSKESAAFRWPVWEQPLKRDAVRSLLTHRAFAAPDYEADRKSLRDELRARGVAGIFCAQRIQVGNPPLHKINFSPASAL
jgi:hypothetical protein